MTESYLLGIAISIAEGHFFSARLPSRFTTKKFVEEDTVNQKYLIQGLYEANALSIVVILMTYYYTKNALFLIIPIAILILLNILYLNDIGILKIY